MKASELIESVDQAKVWQGLIGVSSTSARFRSPFRTDSNPGCKLFKKDGKIKFSDKSKGVCYDLIDAWKLLNPHKSTWPEVCEGILALNGQSLSTKQQIEMGLIKEPKSVLTPNVIPWTEGGLEYWERHGVTERDLSDPETLTQELSGYTITGKDDQGNSYQRSYKKQGFVYWANEKPKFYFPLADKKDKFKGSLTNNDAWLLTRIDEDFTGPRTLVVSKSHKDLHVWKHFVRCSLMAVTAEKVFPDAEWLMTNVRMKFDRVVIVFDDDETGQEGSAELKLKLDSLSDIGDFKVRVWNFPDKTTKDLAGYRYTNTHKETFTFLKENGFYKIFD